MAVSKTTSLNTGKERAIKRRILITGGSGFLGSRLAFFLRERYDLLMPTHRELNVSHEEAVRRYIEEQRPDVVIHCAALSNTWYCEQHPEESHKVNVQGTVRIAKACKLTGAKLIFISSDQVYNGTAISGALKENVPLQPVNSYGQHKLEAEQRAQWNMPESVGLRLTWMYDLPSSNMRLNSNIMVNLQKAATDNSTIKAAIHEYRGVTNVWEVVRNIEKAITLPGGIYNFGSANSLNSHQLYMAIAEIMNLNEPSKWIEPDMERYREQERNLTMDCTSTETHDIHFLNSVEGAKEALLHPFRT